jgi:hypothetical protein
MIAINVQKYNLTAVYEVNEKIRAFERKYTQTWEEFSKSVQEAANENFER